MSNLVSHPQETTCTAGPVDGPALDRLDGHRVHITKTTMVTRMLPHRRRRMVGPWCFLDHFGPDAVISMPGMRVPPHPHIGLQTVTWLFDGVVEHRDSLGSRQHIAPGQLNLMTSGHGISHSEVSPERRPPWLHGVQLWVALPDGSRDVSPAFEHHATLPLLAEHGFRAAVLAGSLGGVASPASVHSPLVAAEIVLEPGASVTLPLDPAYEHAVLLCSGDATAAGAELTTDALCYLGTRRTEAALTSAAGGTVMLVGGEPFEEQIVMWWNFVGRSHDEIAAARDDWMAGDRFGTVVGYAGDPLPAPALPNVTLRPRGRYQER